MALIRNFPVPSDRMAIISTLLNIEDAVVLEYGPEGTTHFSMNFFNKLGQDYPDRLFTTGVDDSDIIMGSTEHLERGILELDALYSPKAIFVLTSSVTSIIGTDIAGICDSLQSKVQSRLIPVNTSGLGADYSAGLRKIYLQLAELFVQPDAAKQKGRYNILGASPLHYRAESDICEITRLLREGFGCELLHCLAMNMTTEALAELSSAELNIVLTAEAVPSAEYLQSVTGTPYVYLPPYGYSQTKEFLNSVAAVIGQPVKEAMLQRLEEKKRRLKMLLKSTLLSRTPGTVFLKGDYDTVKGLGAFFKELKFNVAHSVCTHKITGTAAEGIEYFKEEKEYLQLLKDIRHCLVMADEDTVAQADMTNFKVCVSHPCYSHRTIAKHLPFMGERGADMLFEYIQQYVNM
ncbi:nitrogenase component 1 [Phascolarctobacterium succinatutens]|uniref:nitrogenase component 1 n=1 Tax=Phascolarctobacterium succinatutens TaxID=626940 RepID=UPI003D000CED